MINQKWPLAFKAQNISDYITQLHSGHYKYSTTPIDVYINNIKRVGKRVNRHISTIQR